MTVQSRCVIECAEVLEALKTDPRKDLSDAEECLMRLSTEFEQIIGLPHQEARGLSESAYALAEVLRNRNEGELALLADAVTAVAHTALLPAEAKRHPAFQISTLRVGLEQLAYAYWDGANLAGKNYRDFVRSCCTTGLKNSIGQQLPMFRYPQYLLRPCSSKIATQTDECFTRYLVLSCRPENPAMPTMHSLIEIESREGAPLAWKTSRIATNRLREGNFGFLLHKGEQSYASLADLIADVYTPCGYVACRGFTPEQVRKFAQGYYVTVDEDDFIPEVNPSADEELVPVGKAEDPILDLCCDPLTMEVMSEPVIVPEGQSFSFSSLASFTRRSLRHREDAQVRNPVTQTPLVPGAIRLNLLLGRLVAARMEELSENSPIHPGSWQEDGILRLLEDPLHPGNQMQIDRLVVAPDGLTYDRDTLVELHPRLRGSLFPNLVAQRVFRERLEQCKE